MAVHDRVLRPDSERTTVATTKCTKGGCKLDGGRRMPGAGLSRRSPRKAPLGQPAFQPYWGKLAVRNDRGDRGNVGIIRSPIRASILPDQLYGPAVRCKWVRRAGGKRSCINVSGLRLEHLLRAIMDISARAFSLPDRPRSGHLGHQFSHALGRPNLHLVSSSRRPRLEAVDRVTSSLAPDIAQFLGSSQGPFLRPGPQNVDRVARRGGQGRPSRLACGWLRRCQAAP